LADLDQRGDHSAMFVVMTAGASEAEVLGVKSQILAEGLTPFDHVDGDHVVIAVVGEIGERKPDLLDRFATLPGVARVTPISRPFKLTSREFHPEDSVIRVLDAAIGDGSLTVMAGPCSVESRDQLFETAEAVKAAGATVLRGGAFKPRTSPYASRDWASRRCATSPRHASEPACRSSPR
jgi:3-deoxy-7-phosphoheptulonate synthase